MCTIHMVIIDIVLLCTTNHNTISTIDITIVIIINIDIIAQPKFISLVEFSLFAFTWIILY